LGNSLYQDTVDDIQSSCCCLVSNCSHIVADIQSSCCH
jgi:hypothetical protein